MTKRTLQRLITASLFALVLGAPMLPVLAQTTTSGAFRNLSAIETTLLRGVTSKAEVRKQLGIPNGSGAALFATLGGDEREIWYYEDVEVTGVGSGEQGMKMDMRQQILLVLFKGDVVDGYLWTSNSGAVASK